MVLSDTLYHPFVTQYYTVSSVFSSRQVTDKDGFSVSDMVRKRKGSFLPSPSMKFSKIARPRWCMQPIYWPKSYKENLMNGKGLRRSDL
jgi:hypothetical protein